MSAEAKRPATYAWIVYGADGSKSLPMQKAELDRLAASGRLDARARVQRQDWAEARVAAELYQGLFTPAPTGAGGGTEPPFSSSSRHAPPWAPSAQSEAAAPPRPARPRSRWRWMKGAVATVALLCGLGVFGMALGSPMLQPPLPRFLLFLLFAVYWLAVLALSAGLFNWQWRTEAGELRGLHRACGERGARWLLVGGAAALMALIVWLIW